MLLLVDDDCLYSPSRGNPRFVIVPRIRLLQHLCNARVLNVRSLSAYDNTDDLEPLTRSSSSSTDHVEMVPEMHDRR